MPAQPAHHNRGGEIVCETGMKIGLRYFTEIRFVERVDLRRNGGLLERYNDELCLRLDDEILRLRHGFRVVRRWLRPGLVQFNRDVYA